MTGEHATSFSAIGKLDENGSSEHRRIVELSEIIVEEIGNNTWQNRSRGEKTIFRVPKERLHAADKCTYQPTFLSIGPYYRGEDATEEMQRNEQGKLWWLRFVVQGGSPSVLQLTQAVASLEIEAMSCYEGGVEMKRDAFCKMLLLDAVQLIFLLKLLGQGDVAQGSSNNDSNKTEEAQGCKFKTRDLSVTIHDLMMLENQIPFFVVEKVYELIHSADAATAGNGPVVPVDKLGWETIKAMMVDVPPAFDDGVGKCHHLVHLCHIYLKPTGAANAKYSGEYGRFWRATEYYEAGVRFRRWIADDGSRRPLLDVTFSDGALRMGPQSMDEKTG